MISKQKNYIEENNREEVSKRVPMAGLRSPEQEKSRFWGNWELQLLFSARPAQTQTTKKTVTVPVMMMMKNWEVNLHQKEVGYRRSRALDRRRKPWRISADLPFWSYCAGRRSSLRVLKIWIDDVAYTASFLILFTVL